MQCVHVGAVDRSRRDAGLVCPPAPSEGAAPSARRATVLLVDDDVEILDSLSFLLEDEGYAVQTATNGQNALAVLERIPLPALALVDLRMPVMDGVELIEALRQDPRYARLPVIAFSAAAVVSVPPGVPVLSKPIGVDPLLDAIRHLSGS
jgi:CheY-like chemotaxis protein